MSTESDNAVGLRVSLLDAEPGAVTLAPLVDHRLTIHAGAPARVCGSAPRYHRGDIDIMPAGFSGAWVEEEASTSLVVELAPARLRATALELGLDAARAGLAPRQQLRDAQLEHLAWALDAERRAGYPNGRLYLDSLAVALAVHLLGRYAAPSPVQGLSPRQLGRVIGYIEEHLDRDLSLGRLAAVAACSATHLKTWFKRATGRPVHRYVIERRVERARALLAAGGVPREVALAAGFAHQSHMTSWMRRLSG